MPTPPAVRVIVKLPYTRDENPHKDPEKIEWTQDKADILWKVIERSRSVDSAGADWMGLASHLQVPLPYLLYRVNARFQEEIRGLKDIQGALSPTIAHPAKNHDFPTGDKPLTLAGRMAGSSGLSNSRLGSPLGVRARLSSLGNNSPRPKKATSSSTLTLQAPKRSIVPLRPTSPSSSSDSEDEQAIKEEEADRNAEEEDALSRKLAELQKMMTNEALGLVGGTRLKNSKNKTTDRGRSAPLSPRSAGSSRMDTLSSRSQSISSASSPQGSIGEIPSPPPEPQSHSPIGKTLSSKSPSPAAISSRSALAHAHRRYGPLVDRTADYGSSHGSETSSFSDLSDASISASALESALFSNIGPNSSRL
ncbi:hypothetical protein BYT27DRAFT_7102467 [Phlegmacium glaucopus]|nr:hypothetical protein BYT27DRAFT_7102467 [Phlegmacium glaucopus]